MAQPKNAPAAASAPSPEKVRVRVLVETYGGVRAPIGKRGDVIEIDRGEYEKAGEGVFVLDGVATAQAQAQADRDKANAEAHARQRESLLADRKASALAKALTARQQAEYAERVAKDAEAKAAL